MRQNKDLKLLKCSVVHKESTQCPPTYIPNSGATTIPPNKFRFPPSITTLSADSWVFNGDALWKNGVRSGYGGHSLTTLVEGDTVGVMRRGSHLRFFVNGEEQGIADGNLPEETGVYALVDLYGRCTKVTILAGGMYVCFPVEVVLVGMV